MEVLSQNRDLGFSRQTISNILYTFLSNVNSAHTMKAYRNDLQRFFSFLEEEQKLGSLKRVERVDIVKFRNYLMDKKNSYGKNYSQASINRILATLHSFFEHLVSEGIRQNNPVDKVKRFRIDKGVKSTYLTGEEVDLLLGAIDRVQTKGKLHFAILTLMFNTGMRPTEARELKVKDLSNFNGKIQIVHRLKGGLTNKVFLNEKTEQAIGDYILSAKKECVKFNEDEYLFKGQGGEGVISAATLSRIFKKYAKKAGIEKDVTPHSARVSVISRLSEKGATVQDVANFVGHRDIKTTVNYIKSFNRNSLSELL